MTLFRVAILAFCLSLGLVGGIAAFDTPAFAKSDEDKAKP